MSELLNIDGSDAHDGERVASTGVAGLDVVTSGGLARNRLHLLEGQPGSGKSTVSLQFLIAGRDRGERCLYVTLSESEEELRAVAKSHGWDLNGIRIFEMTPSRASGEPPIHYTVFHPAEIELGDAIAQIIDEVQRDSPSRVVIDSLTELRLLARDLLHYRRQLLALKQFFLGRRCTVLVLDDTTGDDQVQSIMHAVIALEQIATEYGAPRRRLHVSKYRGAQYRGGYHDFEIQRGGVAVFPRLMAPVAPASSRVPRELMSTGLDELDDLIGGGLERGSSVLITGAAGTGKSTLATQVAVAAAQRGERGAIFAFDESLRSLLMRSRGLGLELEPHIERGALLVRQMDPGHTSPGEFASLVMNAVERDGASVVIIDSLDGYLMSMPHERFLVVQLHELLMCLGDAGVATLMVGVQHGMLGPAIAHGPDASYLADSVVLLRYFEAFGEVRQAISVVKKRGGAHERTIREFRITRDGLRIGAPLREFRGVLTGVPDYHGPAQPLLDA